MKQLIKAMIRKVLCRHEWTYLFERGVRGYNEYGFYESYTVKHYACKKCGKYKKIKSF